MTERELGLKLREMYETAPKNEKVTRIHLFGIKYHALIKEFSKKGIIREAGIPTTYEAEINKGIKLAMHVDLRS